MKNSHHAQIEGKWEQCLYLFYEKKIKFISCPNFFFAAHTFFDFQYWVWTETGTF